MKPLRSLALVLALAAATLGVPWPANAFVVLDSYFVFNGPDLDIQATLALSPRWSAANHPEIGGAGLYDGIQVAIEPGFAEKLALAVTGSTGPQDLADIQAATAAAFAAWESPVLSFNVTFDGPVVRGSDAGAEIDVFAVPETDPAFINNEFFGVTHILSNFVVSRTLTNGTVLPGYAITRADIFVNLDMLAAVAPVFSRERQPDALQRLLSHEIGHALGLDHPNQYPEGNLDTDMDPLNPMVIDPTDPFGALIHSPNVNRNAIMSNLPNMLPALLFTSLQDDDRGGRDVLYPALMAPPLCPPTPRTDCRLATKSSLVLTNKAKDKKDALVWKWTKGAATERTDFGDPQTTALYGLCVYRGDPGSGLLQIPIPAAATKWEELKDLGYLYSDGSGAAAGARKIILKGGSDGKAKIVLKAQGVNLPDPILGSLPAPITVQLVNSDTPTCWAATYTAAEVIKNGTELLKAKHSP